MGWRVAPPGQDALARGVRAVQPCEPAPEALQSGAALDGSMALAVEVEPGEQGRARADRALPRLGG